MYDTFVKNTSWNLHEQQIKRHKPSVVLRMFAWALNKLDLNCVRQPTKTKGELMKPVARHVVGEMFPVPFHDWLLISQTDRGRECACND